jgi:serine/threonine protein kinase
LPDVTRTVGRFEIIRRIGRGGMATVYLAQQTGLGRYVALKELTTFHEEPESSLVRRFLQEARLAGALNHPRIVTVYDFFEEDGAPYIAMEYLERGSLRPLVGRLTVAQAAGVLEALLEGLAYAAENGVVHRDL